MRKPLGAGFFLTGSYQSNIAHGRAEFLSPMRNVATGTMRMGPAPESSRAGSSTVDKLTNLKTGFRFQVSGFVRLFNESGIVATDRHLFVK
jgi:hypothetical protein